MFNFAKNKEVADLTTVPEDLHSFYEKKDAEDEASPLVLRKDATVAGAVALATGLYEALTKERKAKAGNQVDLAPLSEYGTDPKAIAEAFTTKVTNLEAQVKDGGAVKKQIEDMKRDMTTAHAAALAERDGTVTSLTNQLDDYMINSEIATAAAAFPGLKPTLIAPFAKEHIKVDVDAESGKRTVVVLDRDGNTRFSMASPGDKANVAELLKDLSQKEDYMRLFPSNAPRGADTKPNNMNTNHRRSDRENLSAADKISRGLASRN